MILYERNKRVHDRTVRCYLTLNCNLNCSFCSAGVPKISDKIKSKHIEPERWAEGINRRNRHTILAGGEPFLYPYFTELIGLLGSTYKIEIYTNLTQDVKPFIEKANRYYSFLISYHPGTDFKTWSKNVQLLYYSGFGIRFHIIKIDDWKDRIEQIKDLGFRITACDNQNSGKKSTCYHDGLVKCTSNHYFYGPDGYRYMCITKMGLGTGQLEHISSEDGDLLQTDTSCKLFGACVGCDNNIEGCCETTE